MNQETKNYIDSQIDKLRRDFKNHTHDGISSLRLKPADFLGYVIQNSVPTDPAIEGVVRLVSSSGKKLYARINGSWVSVTLT